jgi:imidazole glycerol-phosphate synthase subunit HisH
VSGEARATRVAVLDYEMSNLRSATKALERLGARVHVVCDSDGVGEADGVVLPGVGHFGEAVRRMRHRGLDRAARAAAEAGTPLLGICLGLQLLFEGSEESPGAAGLGLLEGSVRRLRTDRKLPHIGWSRVEWVPGTSLAPPSPAPGDGRAATYYFVHAYAPVPSDPDTALGWGDHGGRFCAAAGRGAVLGVQFHPEKSSAAGLGLLGRWLAGVRAGAPVSR